MFVDEFPVGNELFGFLIGLFNTLYLSLLYSIHISYGL